MTAPIDGVRYFSPAFSLVCTGGLAAPATPTVNLVSTQNVGTAIRCWYRIMAFLDGGMLFHSLVSPAGSWVTFGSQKSPKVTVSWSPVPYARAYGIWRYFLDGQGNTVEKLIYFGSGLNIYSGMPEQAYPSQWWGQDYVIWDHVDANGSNNGNLSLGRPVAVPVTDSAYRGLFFIRDLRRIRSSGSPDVAALVNEHEFEDISESPEENVNMRLAGFKRGNRFRFPALFQFEWGTASEQAVLDIWNAEQAHPDDNSLPGVELFASLAFDTSSSDSFDRFNAIQGWAPCRIVAPNKYPRKPIAGDPLVRGEIPMVFEVADPSFTVPYLFDWDSGKPVVR